MVRRHTTLNLDVRLVEEAQRVLGTTQTTETIHQALQEVVDRDKRRLLLGMGTGDLTPQGLEKMRRSRTFDGADTPEPR
jgi:Arc/MetJ family transcription regulator